jgi:hypothetical protein
MATTTPNYGWPVPTSTDLVKDGATAIEALGDAIDATVFGLPSGGLTKISTTTFSAASAVNLAAATFSSTYDNYFFTFYGTCSADTAIRLRMRVGGANETASNYAQMADARNPSTGGIGNYTSYTGSNQFSLGGIKTTGYNIKGWVDQPFATARTGLYTVDIYDTEMNIVTGQYKATTSYDSISLFPDSGTLTGTVSVYGYAK